jgi:hypothetical protein
MPIIAHRGLTDGPNADLENNPAQISQALSEGFDAEIDLWYIDHTWMLGHDGPKYVVPFDFIQQDRLWIHCKNIAAFMELRRYSSEFNFFWHESDLVVLTSKFVTWTYFGKPETQNIYSVCVMPEITYEWDEVVDMAKKDLWYGFCTDFARRLRTATS